MLNGEKQQELGGKGNRLIPVDLAINFSPSQHFWYANFHEGCSPLVSSVKYS
jgi:hypothetical protein